MQGSATTELQHLLSIPPEGFQGNAHNTAAVALAQLQALRDSGDTNCLFLRTVLEITQQYPQTNSSSSSSTPTPPSPQTEELLFHCITGFRHVLLAKWNTFSPVFRMAVRDFFLRLGEIQQQHYYSRTIRMASYNTSATFWKRDWQQQQENNNNALSQSTQQPNRPEEHALLETIRSLHQQLQITTLNGKTELFAYLEAGLSQPGPQMLEAATFLSTLVGEFAGKSASNYNMPLEFHKRAHMDFGDDWLDKSLQMSMHALSQVVNMVTTTSTTSPQPDVIDDFQEELMLSIVQLTIDIIGWDFVDAWDSSIMGMSVIARTVIRPPDSWREYLMHPEFIKAVFHVHGILVHQRPKLGHALRQLLLLLASVHGPMFKNLDERKEFANFLLEGILGLLSTATSAAAQESSELMDTFSMISRLIVNYKMSILVQLQLMTQLFQGMAMIGRHLLHENWKECESVAGDLESMEHREWREEALALLLEGIVMVCGDPWLLYSGDEDQRKLARAALATTLGPLYTEFVTCRTRMARLEEQYLTAHETELDEVREEIFAVDLEEEMASLSNVGRLDLSAALACLSTLFQQLVPQLQSLWDGNVGEVSPEAAGLLEESRLVTMYIGHLLTDDNDGESPQVPDSIVIACQNDGAVTNSIVQAVQTLQQFAQFQVSKIMVHPGDPRLSPLLAKSFLWFLNRWAPAYILPVGYSESSPQQNPILQTWSSPEAVQEAVFFCQTLSLHYHCYWPHERQVQDSACKLLFSMARRCTQMRLAMVSSPSFQQLCQCHCLTAGIRHSAPPAEFESTVKSKAGNTNISIDMMRGYQRLPYDIKSKIVTGLIVGCSEKNHEQSNALLNDCMKTIQEVFSSLVHVLSTKQASPEHVDAMEMTSLCVELYGGVARAGEMVFPERIPKFLTPSLPHLSGLMTFYANDLSICEGLLRFFRDYAEQFIAILDAEACLALFQCSADLLKAYSSVHCASSRVIKSDTEEEQSYNDVLCAIQLLIQLGTRDFVDIGISGVDSSQVTDMIFFGLQQILPLMTRGLLQFPTLCEQYFALVGYMMETYPDKVGQLPFELFDALLESLLFGMSYHDPGVAKASFYGISGIFKEHIQNKVLDAHLSSPQGPALIEKCSRRLLMEVVFQNIIWDRLEAAGTTLLTLAALDLSQFAAVVQGITQQMPPENQQRLSQSFQSLLKNEVLAKVISPGYEGRQNRIRFRKDFEDFCNNIHSFLLMR